MLFLNFPMRTRILITYPLDNPLELTGLVSRFPAFLPISSLTIATSLTVEVWILFSGWITLLTIGVPHNPCEQHGNHTN